MVAMDFSGELPRRGKPSSEWRFHRDILQARPEVGAVIHTHSMFATTLACLRRDIPPFHYMIALAGGDSIRCAPYALFGSQALSDAALLALKDRRACLLANHGMIAVGESLKQALDVTVEVETLCEQYLRALQIGEPHLLSKEEMADVFEQFKGYGKWSK
jgi:L-fuculose-phosphate aldolase